MKTQGGKIDKILSLVKENARNLLRIDKTVKDNSKNLLRIDKTVKDNSKNLLRIDKTVKDNSKNLVRIESKMDYNFALVRESIEDLNLSVEKIDKRTAEDVTATMVEQEKIKVRVTKLEDIVLPV